MNNYDTLVSCLLTVYNRETVKETIQSLLTQTYRDIEIIIVDNCSTDNTVNIIKSINDSRIKLYVNDKNYGQIYSLNRGLSLANGKFIVRIDADDICDPTRIEKQVELMKRNEKLVIVGSNIKLIDKNNQNLGIIKYPQKNEEIKKFLFLDSPFAHPSVMIRKDILINNNMKYNENFLICADYELWTRLLQFGEGENIQEPLVFYRIGENDSSKHMKVINTETNYIKERLLKTITNRMEYKYYEVICRYECKTKRNIFNSISVYRNYIKLIKPKSKDETRNIRRIIYYRFITQNCESKLSKIIVKMRGVLK